MNVFHDVINIINLILNVIGALIIMFGVITSLFEFIKKEIFTKEAVRLNEAIRGRLSSYLILGLEFFIAGDVVKTIITPTWETLGMLGAIVAIRTVLSYFLTKEIKGTKV